jgi:hypothetical protein
VVARAYVPRGCTAPLQERITLLEDEAAARLTDLALAQESLSKATLRSQVRPSSS